MKFALSYSGGKDCMLALHRMVSLGNTPVALITTINGEEERSWFHGIPKTLLEAVSSSLNIPLIACKSQPEQYAEAFVEGLIKAKSLGAEACVFGDIDIADHRKWNEEIAEKAGLGCVLPLWQEEREALVYELISTGYKAIIKIVQSDKLSESFLGQDLSLPLLEDIKATGSDVCGENGEYHSFVYD
ncbi:MAG: adenine nucleotide alpha hydrolase, partial [Coriobacteriales bacterium]|nr:adenine nucleotide alpha hydrolase [Coriobacteriales bacterium]